MLASRMATDEEVSAFNGALLVICQQLSLDSLTTQDSSGVQGFAFHLLAAILQCERNSFDVWRLRLETSNSLGLVSACFHENRGLQAMVKSDIEFLEDYSACLESMEPSRNVQLASLVSELFGICGGDMGIPSIEGCKSASIRENHDLLATYFRRVWQRRSQDGGCIPTTGLSFDVSEQMSEGMLLECSTLLERLQLRQNRSDFVKIDAFDSSLSQHQYASFQVVIAHLKKIALTLDTTDADVQLDVLVLYSVSLPDQQSNTIQAQVRSSLAEQEISRGSPVSLEAQCLRCVADIVLFRSYVDDDREFLCESYEHMSDHFVGYLTSPLLSLGLEDDGDTEVDSESCDDERHDCEA